MDNDLIINPRKTVAYKIMVVFIGLYLAFTPFDYIRNLGIYSHITKIFMLGIFIFFVINNVIEKRTDTVNSGIKKATNKITKTTLLFFAYMLLTIIIQTCEFDKRQELFLLLIQNFVFIFTILSKTICKEDIKIIEIIWLIIMSIFVVLIAIFNFNIVDRTALKFFGGLLDPNIYAASLIIPFLIELKKIINNEGKRVLTILILALMMYSILLSGSRGSLIAIMIATGAYIFIYYKNQHKLKKIFKILLIATAIIILIAPFIPETTLERFSLEEMIEEGGTGRADIWKSALDYFISSGLNNKLIGNGIGTFRYNAGSSVFLRTQGAEAHYLYSHNIIFTILIEGGIVGLILMFLMLKDITVCAYKLENKVPLCAVIGMFIASMFVDMIYLRIFWSVIGYAIIYIKSYDIGEENEKESEHNSTSI